MTYSTHREILELWQGVPFTRDARKEIDGKPTKRRSWLTVLAADIADYLGPDQCDYFTAYRWWVRDSIPVAYHCAIVDAAKRRKFKGVTHEALASIKDIAPERSASEAVA